MTPLLVSDSSKPSRPPATQESWCSVSDAANVDERTSGRISCTAWATATADSAKPVAISLSLPSKVVMSPQAHTRSSEVFIT